MNRELGSPQTQDETCPGRTQTPPGRFPLEGVDTILGQHPIIESSVRQKRIENIKESLKSRVLPITLMMPMKNPREVPLTVHPQEIEYNTPNRPLDGIL